jgi:hypothetical protein
MNTEAAIGTPHYMAPEQVRGREVDGRTDLYALGVIVYQMCTGKMPFTGNTVMEILSARLEQDPTPLEKGKVPEWLEALVMRLLEREREKRPTAEVVLGQLQEVARGQRLLGRQLRWVVAGVLAIALALLWLIVARGGKDQELASQPESEGPERGAERPAEAQGSGGHESRPPEANDRPTQEAGSVERPRAERDESQPRKAARPEPAPSQEIAVPESTKEPPPKPAPAPLEWVELTPADGARVEPGTREVKLAGSSSADLLAVLVNGEPVRVDGRAFEHVLHLGQATLAQEEIAVTIAATDFDGRTLAAKRTLWRAAARAPRGLEPAPGSEVAPDGWARTIRDPRTGLELVLVPADGAEPAFYIGKTEVSWSAYEGVMKRDPSARHDFDQPGFDRRTLDDHPALALDPEEAQRFCASAGFVLPTRQEWVRAAGGLARAYPFGDGPARGVANLEGESGDDTYEFTAPCGALKGDVSLLGVLDLAGNVREWCREGDGITVSGGSWSSDEGAARVDFTPRRRPGGGDDKTGFRVALGLGEDER